MFDENSQVFSEDYINQELENLIPPSQPKVIMSSQSQNEPLKIGNPFTPQQTNSNPAQVISSGNKLSRKRLSTQHPVAADNNKKPKSTCVHKEEIVNLDPNKLLSIHDCLEYYSSDPIVKEYVDLLIEIKIIPVIPSQSVIESYVKSDMNTNVPTEISINLIKNFMTVFQNNYFRNNVNDAITHEVHLSNPIVQFSVPDYQSLPLKTLEDVTGAKKMFMTLIQTIYSEGSKFNTEMKLLRNMKYIHDTLLNSNSQTDVTQIFWNIYCIHFLKAKTEFMTRFKIKTFDWSRVKSKIKHIVPKWRRDDQPPPVEPFNYYANDIVKRIEEGEENFDGNAVASKYNEMKVKVNEAVEKLKTQPPNKDSGIPKFTERPRIKPTRKRNNTNNSRKQIPENSGQPNLSRIE